MNLRSNADIARACFLAYAAGDRPALEALLAPGLRFTSPLDNGLDLATYLAVCWPTHAGIAGFAFVRVIEDGDTVVVTYEQARHDRPGARNTEVLTVRDGRIEAVEVYFGWSLPHPVEAGRHRDPP